MANTKPTPDSPKISQKMLLRSALLLFVLAGLFFTFRYLLDQHGDFDLGSSNSVGMIAAVQRKESGDEVVMIHPDGKIVGTTSWKSDVTDRDPVWEPDGKFLFFSSDRQDKTNSVYRWNPSQDDAVRRTQGRIARTSISFPADSPSDASLYMLMISGGMVQGFDPKTEQTPQLLPPSTGDITKGTEDNAVGQDALFQAMFGKLGTSFSYARWCKGNRYIAGVLETESGGETLIVQDVRAVDGQLPRPTVVISGDHVQFDVNPKDGSLVFVTEGFRFPNPDAPPPQFIKNNKVITPYRHALGIFDPDTKTPKIIAIRPDNLFTFSSPSVSPDGSRVLIVTGPYDPNTSSLQAKALVVIPLPEGAGHQGSTLITGEVYEPSWSPDGENIVFAMSKDGHRDLYTITKNGSSLKNLTNGQGDFENPKFSPQMSASSSGS